MAEESDLEKTEQASDQRLEKAREEGDIPRSKELATFAGLLAATFGFWILGQAMMDQFRLLLGKGLRFERSRIMEPALPLPDLEKELIEFFGVFAPFTGLIILTALFSPILIGGWLFSAKAIAPNFGKLNPMKGLGNMFSTRTLIELLKAILKSMLVGVVAWQVIDSEYDDIFALISQPLSIATAHQGHLLLLSFTFMVASLAVIALIDAPYQMFHYANKMKMTRQQVKDETKENMGNPQIKSRQRSMQRAIARRRMMAEVPKADVVITNPTHYAVALKYHDDSNQAPLVIAKGTDEMAKKIREVALEHKVILMEAPPLARALYTYCELGDEIPGELYTAVALVLAYVFQLRNWQTLGGYEPLPPEQVSIPPDMDPLTSNQPINNLSHV
jgi:flagellar biosynthetic protein FlhB